MNDSIDVCPRCNFDCNSEQIKNFGACIICVVAQAYGFSNQKIAALPAPKPKITIDEVLDAVCALQPKTVTLAQLGLVT